MNEQRYNAFISYRRTEHDTAVAKEIQNSLERLGYRGGFAVPREKKESTGSSVIRRSYQSPAISPDESRMR